MGEGAKRLYIGNLPSNITDTDLRTKFSKFGNVEAVEIKLKKDAEGNTLSTFAFLNLSTSPENIAKCINTFSHTKWKGHPLRIQMAQESFISRLQKERQENQMKNRRDSDPDDTTIKDKDSESGTLRNFCTDKFSYRDKFENLGQDNKYHQKTNEGPVGKKFKKNWGLGDRDSKDRASMIRIPSERTKGKSDSLSLSDQETQLSPGIKAKKVKRTDALKEHDYSDFDSDNSDETPVNPKHVPRSQSTENILVSESKKKFKQHSQAGSVNSDASIEDKTEAQRENTGSRSSSLGLKLEKEMMQRFEAFNSSWKDSRTVDEVDGEKASKSYVKHLDTEKVNETPVVQKQGGKKTKRVKTKNEKPRMKMERHAFSDHRRIKSMQEKAQIMKGRKRIIREALSALDSGSSQNKKIVFDSEDKGTPEDRAPYGHVQTNTDDGSNNQEPDVKGKRHILFPDDTEDEANKETFKIQHRFEGVKGEKLMKLQSSFASDDRFRLDERFYESDEDTVEGPNSETSLQMKKKIFKDTSQLRFDPTKEDHEKFILKCDKDESNEGKKKKKDKNVKKEEEPPPEVSSERYFEVSKDLRQLFKKDTADKSQGQDFSLLKLMGRLDKTEAEKEPEESYKVASLTPQKQPWTTENPFRYDSGDSEQEEEPKTTEQEKKDVLPTLEYFFFQNDDERLKEGTDFFSQQSRGMDFDIVKCMKQEKLRLSLIKKRIKNMAKKLKNKKTPGRGMGKHFRTRRPVK